MSETIMLSVFIPAASVALLLYKATSRTVEQNFSGFGLPAYFVCP
jgi:hypothetical protein